MIKIIKKKIYPIYKYALLNDVCWLLNGENREILFTINFDLTCSIKKKKKNIYMHKMMCL